MDESKREEFEELARMRRQLNAKFNTMCKEHNFDAEQRGWLKEKIELDELIAWERAGQIRERLDSEEPSSRQAAILDIMTVIQEQTIHTMGALLPLIEGINGRLSTRDAKKNRQRKQSKVKSKRKPVQRAS